MSSLTGKVAVVTGASKGIGAGIAKGMAAAGASVVVNYSSSKEGADKVVAEIEAAGGKAIAVQGDMSKPEDVKQLFAETKSAYGALDVLVNNAGVFAFQPIEAITADEFHRQFNTNVLGPILTTQEALNHFPASGGSIINISSVASKNPPPTSGVYSATKGALDSLTQAFAKELGARHIRVNTLAPGGTATEGARTLGMVGSDMEKGMVAQTPLGRIGQPEDMAPVAVFLASDDAQWITGEWIAVAGGLR